MKVIGITGGIASGKSIVANVIKRNNYLVIDADEISRSLMKEAKVIAKIQKTFGDRVIENEKVNRKELGKIVFDDPNLRLKLEAIIHPKVKKEIKKQLKN